MKHKLNEIAKQTGYSITTVSRALNSSSRVPETTRLKILETARKIGYLRSEKTVILVISNLFVTYYCKSLLKSLQTMLHIAGYRIVAIPLEDIQLIDEINPCAVIAAVREDDLGRYWSKKYDIPLVCLNTASRHLEGIYSIYSNEEQGMNVLLEHLLSLGHKRIGLLGDSWIEGLHSNAQNLRIRLETFRRILRKRNLPDDLIAGCSLKDVEYSEAVYRLLDKRITAVVNLAEPDIPRILHYIRQAGLKVPRDISVCGWLSEMDLYCDPPITGIMPNYDYLANHTLVMLNRLLHREAVIADVPVDYNWFLRRSTALPKKRK